MSNHQQLALVLPPTAQTVNWRGFAEYFDLCAENNPSFQELRSSLLEQLGGLVLPPGPILDVGAGTGNFSIPLARMFPDRQIIHLDPEPGMNERAREKAHHAGLTNLSIRQHDCHALELEPGSVAAVVTVHALYACPDPHAVIARVRPWLHPDGYLVACDLGRRHSSWDWGWYFFRHYWRRHGLAPALRFMARIRGFKQHTDQIGKSQRSGKYWTHTLEQFVQAFEEAGFSVVGSIAVTATWRCAKRGRAEQKGGMMSASNSSSSLLSRPMLALYAISLCSGVALSTFALLTSTWMEQAGITKFVIGLVGAAYYAFQIVGGPLAERLLRRRDARFALALGLLIAAIASPSFVLTKSAACLWLVRAIAGVGVGITVTVGQTLLLARTAPAQRGSASGLHALGFALGMALGPAIGTPLYQLSPALAAGFGASVLLAGFAASTLLPGSTLPLQPGRQRVADKLTLPLHGIFAYGFAESALFALYPAVLVQGGMRVSQIGMIFLCFVAGSIAATLPLTRLGDVIGRRRVLSGCVLVGTAAVLTLLWAPTYPLVLACGTLAGGAVGSSYALNVALVGDALSAEELPSGMALFTIALGLGCVAGPLVTGATVAAFGGAATFIPTAVVFAALLARLAYPSFAPKPVTGLRGGA